MIDPGAVPSMQTADPDPQNVVVRDYNQRDYRESWEGSTGAFEHHFESEVLRDLLPEQSGWWMDVGAGYGRILPLYFKEHRNIVLVDYAVNLLELAAERNPSDNVHFVAADAYHLPFRDESFDAALSIHTFAHINTPSAFLSEMARVVRAGAPLVLEFANKRSLVRILRYGLRSFRVDREEYLPLFFGTHPKYFARLCEEAGLSVQRSRGSGYVSRFLVKAPVLEPLLRVIETVLMSTVGFRELASRSFAAVRKVAVAEAPDHQVAPTRILDILVCPACRGPLETSNSGGLQCQQCDLEFARIGRIYDLRYTGDARVEAL